MDMSHIGLEKLLSRLLYETKNFLTLKDKIELGDVEKLSALILIRPGFGKDFEP